MLDQAPRQERVPFTRPVRVTALDGQKPPMRLLSGNLSIGGMFLRSPLMLGPGTRVELSLEAKGMPLPLAEAEVVWQRQPASGAIALPGFGVRFIQFLHPKAEELVQTLIARKKEGEPNSLPPAPPLDPFVPKDAPLSNGSTGLEAGLSSTVGVPLPQRATGEEPPVPRSALRPMRGRTLTMAAFALLLALPVAVAIGTWRAISTDTLTPSPSIPPPPAASQPTAPVAPLPTGQPALTLSPATVAAEPLEPLTMPEHPMDEAAAPPAAIPDPVPVSISLDSPAVRQMRVAPKGDELQMQLEMSGGSHILRVFSLASPARLVVDVVGPRPKQSSAQQVQHIPGMRQVRVGALPEGTRLVIDFTRPIGVLVRDGQVISAQLR